MRDYPIIDTHTHTFPCQSIVGRGIDPRMGEDGVLVGGRVIADGPRAEVRRDPQGREIYLGA